MDLRRLTGENRKQSLGIGVGAEGAVEVHEPVTISRAEDEAGSKLEGIVPEAMLPESASFCTCAGFPVLWEENVKQVAGFQFCSFVRAALRINQ